MGRLLKDLDIGRRLFQKGGLPVSLIFFVTSRCNLLCRHCFYWEELNQPKNELTLEEIRKVARSLPNLLSLSLTGGEPYLRKDLPEIAETFETFSRVRNIQIPSNGLVVRPTLERLEALLQKVRRARVSTGVSLDGPEEIHNEIRQNPKSFDRALESLEGMKKLKKTYENLSVGVALTVTAANQDRLESFFEYVRSDLEPDAITITLARGNPIDGTLKEVDLQRYTEFAQRVLEYRQQRRLTDSWMDRMVIAKEAETYRLVTEAAASRERISPCYAGDLIGILSETGDVYLCETLDRTMGNVRDFDGDLARLWVSDKARQATAYQKELQCQCTYECAMSVNTLFNPRRLGRILADARRQKKAEPLTIEYEEPLVSLS